MIRAGFEWVVARFIMLGAAMLGLWILAIMLIVSKLVGEDRPRVVEVEAEKND